MGNSVSAVVGGPFGLKRTGYVQQPNGDYYKGPTSALGLPHGSRGILLLKNGEVYVGSFDRGRKHGRGIFVDAQHNRFEGTWCNDHRDGKETVRLISGTTQVAHWSNGCLLDQQEQVKTPQANGFSVEHLGEGSPASKDSSDTSSPRHSSTDAVLANGTSNVERWSAEHVCDWLAIQGIPAECVEAFRRAHITGQTLLLLDHDSLHNNVGLTKFGDRTRLLHLIRMTKKQTSAWGIPDAAGQIATFPREPPESFYISFDELQFTQVLGSGRRSRVFKGRWLGRDVAIKVFCGYLKDPKKWMKYTTRLSELRHPSIVLILGLAISPPYYCIIMEYYPNRSVFTWLHGDPAFLSEALAEHSYRSVDSSKSFTEYAATDGSPQESTKPREPSRRGPMTVQLILRVARGISLGCAYLKQKNFEHLNLKSSNVMLDESLNVKLTDFGTATLEACFAGHPGDTNGSVVAEHLPMTPLTESLRLYYWSAPEALREAKAFGISSASDVYSFGIILWEMLTCSLPFRGMTNAQVIGAVGYGGDQPAEVDAPQPMRDLVSACLYDEPAVRPKFVEIIERLGRLYETANSSAEDALITFMGGT